MSSMGLVSYIYFLALKDFQGAEDLAFAGICFSPNKSFSVRVYVLLGLIPGSPL